MLKQLQLFLFLLFTCWQSLAREHVVTINQTISHPALDAARTGIMQALEERGLLSSTTVQEANAQGNIATTIQIAKHHASLQPDVMVAIATPAAQANQRAARTQALAFVAVNDPKAAGLVAKHVFGVTDRPPIDELITVMHQILPNKKVIGVLYNPGEINSLKTIEELDKIAKSQSLTIKKVSVTSSSHIKMAIQKLVGQAEIIYLPPDNLVVSSIETITNIANKSHIPVIANDPSLVPQGLLFALGSDYLQSGKQLGHLIADHLQNKTIDPKIQAAKHLELKINHDVAKQLAITLPTKILWRGES